MYTARRRRIVLTAAVLILANSNCGPGAEPVSLTAQPAIRAKGDRMAAIPADAERTAAATRAVIDSFNAAFNRHDAEALASLLTEDTVFEDTSPAPDGNRIQGRAAVVAFWREWFARNADAHFDAEDVIVSGNRAVVLWVYRKMRNAQPWHIRGVDVFTVRDGKVAAKLAYVKG